MKLETLLAAAVSEPLRLSADELSWLLRVDDLGARQEIFAAAREVKSRCGKVAVLPRGLIEVSNRCAKDCLYCGIRRGNSQVARYHMSAEEVLSCCAEARQRGYHAVAFQSGELESEANTSFYEALVRAVQPLEVTLSLGEQTESVYARWKASAGDGVLRYLLRIETSNRELYARIHPAACSFDRRLACIRALKRLGYITGTGVMIGLPGQTVDDLARDLVFFGEERVDMVGMGPYISHPRSPLAPVAGVPPLPSSAPLVMIALARLYLHDVNIVATTALETLDPVGGRQAGIDAGANVIMPNLTPAKYRENYDLYPGKADAALTA